MKKIEKANIEALHDNMLSKDLPIVSITLDFQDSCCSQGTEGYVGKYATNFIENLMTILNINSKSKIEGKAVLVCSEAFRLLAIGNEEGTQWIDLKDVSKIIDGDIVGYLEEKDNKKDNER